MPERTSSALTLLDRAQLSNYTPGYDWIPGKFGPPPGIPQRRKEQLDRLSDRDFMAAVMRMGQEEKESLMISEAERLRTYRSLWPNPPYVSYKELAREGFYYTGKSDRVQCAFCGGFLGNWEAGDNPKEAHKQFFGYCRMALRKPCPNIPLSNDGEDLLQTLSSGILSARADDSQHMNGLSSVSDLGIDSSKPIHSQNRIYSNRLSTYQFYSTAYPMPAESLCTAGFYYEGPGDKVRCFWCDGALELWSEGDDAWEEHAKWYPGCSFLQQVKGKNFITKCRLLMTSEDKDSAESLQYNNSGTGFLEKQMDGDEMSSVDVYDSYQVCKSLGFSVIELDKAFSYNEGEDIGDVQALIDILLAERQANRSKTDAVLKQLKANRRANSADDSHDYHLDETLQSETESFLDMDKYLKGSKDDMTVTDSLQLIAALTCSTCLRHQTGAALLPCGHFLLCHKCSITNLPGKCFVCKTAVKGACKTFLC